jgi:transcriptional regulator with XRE-family HTH domain
MKDRILQFLSAEKISPAEFADKIGVQRSSMSHILNGRNYPSASFIQKMLHAYPLINSRWLMIGEGKMNIGSEREISRSQAPEVPPILPGSNEGSALEMPVVQNIENTNVTGSITFENKTEPEISGLKNSAIPGHEDATEKKAEQETIPPEKNILTSKDDLHRPQQPLPPAIFKPEEKEIEQILFFYKDKTFSVYRPS